MEKSFRDGMRVKTNEKYFGRFNRVMYGVVESDNLGLNNTEVAVRIMHQEGRAIPALNEVLVLMRTDDIEIVND